MNRRMFTLAAVTLAVAASFVTARDNEGAPASRPDGRETTTRPEARRDAADKRVAAPREFAKLAETAGLTDEQMLKIAELVTARNKAIVEIQSKYQAEILALLTDDQRAKREQAVIVSLLERRFAKAALTPDQLEKIKSAVAEAAGKKALTITDERSAMEAVAKFSEFVTKEVLTDAQRDALREPAREGPTRETARDGERRDTERRPETNPAPRQRDGQ